MEQSRKLHKYWSKRGKASTLRAAKLDSALLHTHQAQAELESQKTRLQTQLDEITSQLARAKIDCREREEEVTRLKEELQVTSHQARTQSTVASALGLKTLVLEDELVEQRVNVERWQARYDQLDKDFRRFVHGQWTPSASPAGIWFSFLFLK